MPCIYDAALMTQRPGKQRSPTPMPTDQHEIPFRKNKKKQVAYIYISPTT
jgi:hypothetical protein